MKKGKIIICALVLTAFAVSAFGTRSFFTAHRQAENSFMIAAFDQSSPVDPDSIFSAVVFETDEKGNEVTGQTYEGIAPGDVLHKDPTARNTGKYPAYIRMSVTVSMAENWKKSMEKYGIASFTELLTGIDREKWLSYGDAQYDNDRDTLTYVFYLKAPLEPGQEETLFTSVTVPREFTQIEMAALAHFNVNVSLDAIQSANTGHDSYEAFKLF